jgi:hypothetical protein
MTSSTMAELKDAVDKHNTAKGCIPPSETKSKKRAIAALTKEGVDIPVSSKPAKPKKPRKKKEKKPLSQHEKSEFEKAMLKHMHGGGPDPRIKTKKVISQSQRKMAWLKYYAGGGKKPSFKEHVKGSRYVT